MAGEIPTKNDPINWLHQYGDALYRFARVRVRDSFTAEDLVQETLLAAYRSREGFSRQSTVKTWLTGILKHKIMDYYRKLKPEQGDESIDDFSYTLDNLFNKHEKWKIKPGEWGGDPQNLFEGKELMSAIQTCLKRCRWHSACARRKEQQPVKSASYYRQEKITAGLYSTGQECFSGVVLK